MANDSIERPIARPGEDNLSFSAKLPRLVAIALLCAGACHLGFGAWYDATPTSTASGPTSKPATAPARPLSEDQKIEALLSSVQALKDAVFIRNDRRYGCREAVKHFRDKWEWKKSEIRTARDFIRIAASVSSASGKPYLIRLSDGQQMTSREFLTKELARIEAGGAASKATTQAASRPTGQ